MQQNRLSKLLEHGLELSSPRTNAPIELLKEKVKKVRVRWSHITATNAESVEHSIQKVNQAQQTSDWTGCYINDVTVALEHIFDPQWLNETDFEALRHFLLEELETTQDPKLLNAGLSAYLRSFHTQAGHSKVLSKLLGRSSVSWWSKDVRILRLCPAILDPERATSFLCDLMLKAPHPFRALQEVGVKEPYSPGLMTEVHSDFIVAIAQKMGESNEIERLQNWMAPSASLKKSTGVAQVICALMEPWLQTQPPEAVRRPLSRWLVDNYKDPRLFTGYPWTEVPERYLVVLKRWLGGENLIMLFDAISQTMVTLDQQRMWTARRRFYLDLHEQNRIDEAWVAFSSNGSATANAMLRAKGEGRGIAYGRQIAEGSRSDTSILIARVGQKIILDGSHSYKVHIFDANDPKAPKLYQQVYDCDRLRDRAPKVPKKAHNGRWQEWVELRI